MAVELLCSHLGEKGDINQSIANLVKKGMSVKIKQALDIVRVVGNKAVHPGVMDLNETPETAHALFELINVIVDSLISEPKRINEIFESLPHSSLKAIAQRDGD